MPPTPPIALVTGTNTGIGRVTARELARIGYRVFLACRLPARTRPVLDEIATVAPGLPAEWLALELADLDSMRACGQDFLARDLPLHLLSNNAGLAAVGKVSDRLRNWAAATSAWRSSEHLFSR